MKVKNMIIRLHKKKIVSDKPHPFIPFALFFLVLILIIPAVIFTAGFLFIIFLIALAAFTLIFAILHFIVWFIIKKGV